MKRYTVILAVLVVMIAMAVAGCTTTSPSAPAPDASKEVTTPGGATTTPASTSSGSTTLGSLVDYKNVKWYEYQMTTDAEGTSSTMKMREDFSVDYQGKKANKVSIDVDSGSGDSASTMVMTSYSDPSSGATLGGHMKMTMGDQVITDQDIQPSAAASTTPGASTENPLLTFQGTSITNSGTESVTVPAGTYTATKYTWTSGDATGTAWIAPNVPVPVKITTTSEGSTADMELTGWG